VREVKDTLIGMAFKQVLEAEVEGFSFLERCIWEPAYTELESNLSFVYSAGNLKLFQRNYKLA